MLVTIIGLKFGDAQLNQTETVTSNLARVPPVSLTNSCCETMQKKLQFLNILLLLDCSNQGLALLCH